MFKIFKKNGKLTAYGKLELERMRQDFFEQNPQGWIVYPNEEGSVRKIITVCREVSKDGLVIELANSICHPNDKYREKVGEFIALQRFFEARTIFTTKG